MEFLAAYGYIGILLLLSIGFAFIMMAIPFILGLVGVVPKKPSAVKSSTYECGPEAYGDAWVQFNFRYYLFALLFVLFDIEIVFLYPWAVTFTSMQFRLFGLIEMLIFIFILFVGYIYAWKKGALQWT